MVRIVLCIFASYLQNHFCLGLLSEFKSHERSHKRLQRNAARRWAQEVAGRGAWGKLGDGGKLGDPDRKFANHQAVVTKRLA